MMRKILSKHDLRQLQLLESLLKNKQKWLSLKELSDLLGIPIRTLHADVHEINTYIGPVHIKVSSFGIKISIPSNYSERYLYKKILEESREFQLIEHVFTNEGETIESLADKLFISLSTTKRMIRDINYILQNEGFFIHGKPLSFLGNERKLTQFMSYYFTEKYFFLEEFMSKEQHSLITTLITTMMDKMGKKLNYPEFKRRAIWSYLKCIRLKNNHQLPVAGESRYSYSVLYDKIFRDDFCAAFGIHLTDKSIQQLFHILTSDYYVCNMEDLRQLILRDLKQKELYQEIETILNNISGDLNIPLDMERREKLLIDLLNIINLRGNRIYVLYNRGEHFLSNISACYFNIQNILESYIKDGFSFVLTVAERSELTYILLTHWPELYKKICSIELPVNVFLLIDADVELGMILKEELETYAHYNIETTILTTYTKGQLSGIAPDCVLITNIPGIQHVACPVLCIDTFMNRWNWDEFDIMIEDINAARKG